MSEFRAKPNRYDGRSAAAALATARAEFESGRGFIELELGPDHQIHVEFPCPDSAIAPELLELARGVLLRLSAFDNIVQNLCAADWARSGLPSRAFESLLAFVKVDSEQVSLHYWGAAVNTEWDEVFARSGFEYKHVRSGTGPGTGEVVSVSGVRPQ